MSHLSANDYELNYTADNFLIDERFGATSKIIYLLFRK